jgi:type I restriction enzyme S subunit
MLLDLTTHDQKTVVTLLKAFLPETTIWAFGSRMKFTSKPESDLDLVAFIDPEQQSQLAELKDAFVESDLPFKVDILDWNVIPDSFKENIKKAYINIDDLIVDKNTPKNWKTLTLREICDEISYGYTESASWENIGPKFLRITDIRNYFVDWTTVPRCPITTENHIKYKLEIGDIVIARTGATTGITSIFNNPAIDAVFASYLIRYRINKNVANPFYIAHVLKSSLWKSHVSSIIGGSAQPGANAQQFADFKFDLPTIDFQNIAANILSSLDDKIGLNIQINQTLESITQNIFQEWFINFNTPGFEGELVGGLPKGWKKGKLGEIIDVKGGGTPSTANADYWNGDIYWTTPKDLSNNQSHVLLDTERKITVRGVEQISSGILPKGTLLLSSRAPIGYLAISQVPVAINQGYIAIQGKSVSNYFMLYWLIQNMDSIKGRANGSTFQEISKSNFKDIDIVIPDSETLKRFDDIANSIFCKIVSNEIENGNLSELRDSLLPKLMSGKIQISNGLD